MLILNFDNFSLECFSVKNTKKESTAKGHKASLEKLKQQDPEFYKFLEKEDQELLQFESTDDDEDESSEEDNSSEEEEEKSEESANEGEVEGEEEDEDGEMDSDVENETEDDDRSSDEEGTLHELPKKLEASQP